jgi:hypothetical protein
MTLIKPTLDAYASTLNKTWQYDRTQSVGASEIGQCELKIFWLKNEADHGYAGVDRDPDYVDSWGARMRGTMFENHFWEPAMRIRFGERLKFAGIYQQTFFNEFLSATPDGLITELTDLEKADIGTDADCVMVECKTADPRTNLVEAKPENVYQTHVQMGLIRECTEYQPTHSVLSYTDASFWSDVKEFVIAFDQEIYDAAIARAQKIMTTKDFRDLDPEGWIAGGKECNYCPFTKACGIHRRELPFTDVVTVDPQFRAEITDLAVKLRQAESAGEKFETRVRELQTQIKNRLREKGVRKIPGVVSWSSVKGRSGYDAKAIKEAAIAAGIDIEQFQTTGEPSDRLLIQIGSSNQSSNQASNQK